ncbi:Ankyrin repeat-containing domain protein [Rutstroemia sp. NJR-2017a WRK4]|nr:Ankyrin repeat-containing domain protein [Rutstroemia sp. NJR-2017a WRK4]
MHVNLLEVVWLLDGLGCADLIRVNMNFSQAFQFISRILRSEFRNPRVMAEVVASGMGIASLGLQLLDNVKKLKEFWDSVKEAPDDVRHALIELEILRTIIDAIPKNDSDMPAISAASSARCLELCYQVLDLLEALMKDMNQRIEKRLTRGSIRVVLKKGTIDRFRGRLRNAQDMLVLCRQTYFDAVQAERHRIQLQRMDEIDECQRREFLEMKAAYTSFMAAKVCVDTSKSKDLQITKPAMSSNITTVGMARGRKPHFKKKLQMPFWFPCTSWALDFSAYRAPAGWDFTFRQYYTLHRDSPAWRHVVAGDVVALQELFESKKATPFDRLPWGYTLLDNAATNLNPKMCQFLIDAGADMSDSCRGAALPAYASWPPPSILSDIEYINTMRLILPKLEVDDLFEQFARFARSPDVLSWLLDSADSEWRQRDPTDRAMFALHIGMFESAMKVRYNYKTWASSILQLVVQKDELSEEICAMEINHPWHPDYPPGTFLIITVQDLVASLSSWVSCNPRLWSSEIRISDFEQGGCLASSEITAIINLTKELVRLKSDIHHMAISLYADTTVTILFLVLIDFYEFGKPGDPIAETAANEVTGAIPHITMRIWLEILLAAGVDLMEYGKKEHDWFCKNKCIETYHGRFLEDPGLRLISFTYGPKPDDWRLRWVFIEEYYGYYRMFREFWSMVDHPERATPGAWDAAPQWEPNPRYHVEDLDSDLDYDSDSESDWAWILNKTTNPS